MHVVVIGAGPAGLFGAIALARRGRAVTLVDRDGGPPRVGPWMRRGVMQFAHAHTVRGQVVDLLAAQLPDVLVRLRHAGARIVDGADGTPAALQCRRSTFEAVLWRAAAADPRVALRTAHADGAIVEHGRVRGVRFGALTLDADVVVDATGRAGRFTPRTRPSVEGECAIVYVTRQYRLRDGAPPAESNSPVGLSLGYAQYFAIAFAHDAGTFSITFAHDGSEPRLRALRHPEAFTAAVDAIPRLRDWTDPARSAPISGVLPAGRIHNRYRRQVDPSGAPATPGLVSVGDAVCTTTPLAGRGVTLAMQQADALVTMLDEGGVDGVVERFDAWCDDHVRPWFDDHCHADADRARRWGGGDVDVTTRLPSDLIVAAREVVPEFAPTIDAYARMHALPASLRDVEPVARAHYAAGWRPTFPEGPTRDALAELCADSVSEVA